MQQTGLIGQFKMNARAVIEAAKANNHLPW